MSRVQVILNEQERELFRQQASLNGLSLSAWMRKAAHKQLAESEQGSVLSSVEALETFFAECDQREPGKEPDWKAHLEVINRSRGSGSAEI